MSWFRRNPPPPPPVSKVPAWVQLAVPIIFAIIMGLAALSFDGYKSHAEMRMDENKASIEKLEDAKVDNKTMQLMIQLQQQQIKSVSDQLEDVNTKMKDVNENLDEIKQLVIQQSK